MKRNSILLCILFAITANFIAPAAKAQVNTTDSLALVDLYNSTDGSNWTNHTNWLTANPVSTWFGITVTGSRVVEVKLTYNGLNGAIPASIGNLTNLTDLYLNSDQLTGTIPAEIGNLTNLSTLILAGNQLTGAIPAEIGNLTNLNTLILTDNLLTGTIPAEIGNLTALTTLYINFNKLTGTIPSAIGNLTNLTDLAFVGNQLSGAIPGEIGNLVKLKYLSLDNNQLSGALPSSIGNLVNLTNLRISQNKLSGAIPAALNKLTKLFSFDISYNRLSSFESTSTASTFNSTIYSSVNNNLFTFHEVQFIATKYQNISYAPQDTILPIHQTGNTLSVSAGGTLSKNTYTWYKSGNKKSTIIKGDSTFHPTQSGNYYAHVTNSVANQLTLYSNTVSYTMPLVAQTNNSIANIAEVKTSNTHFSVYPNPASNLIHIQTTGTATIILTNSAGKTLLTKTINNSDVINVSTYANGVYYIQNKTTGEVQKIIITH